MRQYGDRCGLFGVFGAPDAVDLAYLGLYAQQHRGQESAGIASIQDGRLACHKAMGLVADVFDRDTLARLKGPAAIGHVRYSTTGESTAVNAQPLVVETGRTMLAVAHNGNLVNSGALRRDLETQGRFFPIFHTTTDTEVILYLAARERDLDRGLRQALTAVEGAYSLLFLTPTSMIAARDPHGIRPLALGRLPARGGAAPAWCVASETSAFDLVGAERIRDVEPGEILVFDGGEPRSSRIGPARRKPKPAHCFFEHVYFARPDSYVHGDLVWRVRRALGRRLAEEHPVAADLVTPVPDSGTAAALGDAEAAKLPFEMAFMRNHYVGRTFIQPRRDDRASKVEIKLSIIPEVVRGKRVVVVDDSIIRGTTSRARIRSLRRAGAKEVHLRISCPPTRHPCWYGIDFPDPSELIAANLDLEGIRKQLELDSLGYLSLEGMLAAGSKPADHYCTACWSGRYAVRPSDTMAKDQHERRT